MGPKAAPVAEASPLRDGANLIYIQCSLPGESGVVSVSMNLNCRVDIILDFAMKLLKQEVASRTVKIQAELANPEVPVANKPEGEEGAASEEKDAETINTEKKGVHDRLVSLSEALQAVSGLDSVELEDESGTHIGVQELLAQNGVEALKPAHAYKIGVISAEEKAFVPF